MIKDALLWIEDSKFDWNLNLFKSVITNLAQRSVIVIKRFAKIRVNIHGIESNSTWFT